MGAGGLANRFGSSPGSSGAAGAGSGACFAWDFVTPGLPDAAFEDAPGFSPTPMELRVMLLAHLRPRADSVVWDVGGGTGALALEIARLMPAGTVHTLERDPEAIDLLQRNRRRFAIENLHIQAGQAPDDLHLLPPHPDRVLLEVGRPLSAVLHVVWRALQPGGRLVISTANLEGLVDATDTLGQLEALDVQVVQATVHRMQRRGSQARLAAAEPLFLIAAERHG
ncbi:precorrin-6Y C5,15-methyltransferase subunit CbiT [Synechococcus sp. CS-602]|uniref:precorrin-6Y C5,15-methyltransferase subunit CbiT n=1 Tax=Synechococcaceae TaxID=1890426 RepID=UPI0009FAEE9C|nr:MULTISPECIES: precorrin-6Y C5,15-methyltransferase subunit CbiT [Synechococcaceae]MCT4363685.1 precorrin-6Y C5,15-methyltransferase subunit CbiT [Candidatus Regnicoccus frigidus MAG-AL1]MCT0202753.1 precorrin-6Y C5,15-methyltransferase subunit CbiT [Synechococcus sp. CS-603]MCT0203666.1 precorrin-6Y C5,15-methyltransferase subunit CbiT [Synechococcus sp. CS-602]MCT0245337.1 precorrin-6Y C5,15-methyltransferase subunit CbiT [Synechococcus sp. CS-601]MCT4366847.1 precorrin-6Y C5,15-methyltran